MSRLQDPIKEAEKSRKISMVLKGRIRSPEHCKHLSEARLGKFNCNIVKRYNKITLTEPQKAWLACAIDTDGSIQFVHKIYTYSSGVVYPVHTRAIQFFNTNTAFMEHIAKLINEPITVVKIHSLHWGRKPVYKITVRKTMKIYDLLIQIKQYLVIKKDIAEEICKFVQERFKI